MNMDEKKIRSAFIEHFGEYVASKNDEQSVGYQVFRAGYRQGYLKRTIEANEELRELAEEIESAFFPTPQYPSIT